MSTNDFETHRAARLAEGFDEVAESVWPLGAEVATGATPWAARRLQA